MTSNSHNEGQSSTPTPAQPGGTNVVGVGGHFVPFLELLNIHATETNDGHVVFEMDVDDRHLRPLGIMHGGATASLMDTALGFAAGTMAPAEHHVVTVQLNVNYIRPAWNGEKLIAKGTVQHSGRQTAVSRGELRTSRGVLVATATATFMYIPTPKGDVMEHHDETERCP